MPREYKALPQFTMGIDERTVTGIAVVHGNVDDGGDRSHPGLLGDGTIHGRRRAVFLWQHDSSSPPIAAIDRIFEVAAADLPPAVKLYAPGTTGGIAVQRTYLDTPRGSEVLAGIKASAITEMSYAFELTKWDFEEVDDDRTIRNLYQANVFDFSDVSWGMNPATSATGLKTSQPIDVQHATVLAAVADYTNRYQQLSELRAKEGRVLSGENRKRIESAMEALGGAISALKDLLAATEPKRRREAQNLYQEWQRLHQRSIQLGVRDP